MSVSGQAAGSCYGSLGLAAYVFRMGENIEAERELKKSSQRNRATRLRTIREGVSVKRNALAVLGRCGTMRRAWMQQYES